LCLRCVQIGLVRACVCERLFGCNAACRWSRCSKHNQVSKYSSRRARRAGAQIRFACHIRSHLRYHSRPALLSDPDSLGFMLYSCFSPAINFFLLIMTPRSTQEPLVADKLALMLVPTAANQDLYLFGVRLIGSQRGVQLQQQYYYKQRLRKMATICLNRHFDSDTLCMMTI
jgi:hypothetical protein